MLFADGRTFQIAGTVLSDGTTIIPFAAITLLDRPNEFPIPPTGVVPPIIFVNVEMIDHGTILVAMSISEYNKLAIAQTHRDTPSHNAQPSILQRAATGIARRCGACGRK